MAGRCQVSGIRVSAAIVSARGTMNDLLAIRQDSSPCLNWRGGIRMGIVATSACGKQPPSALFSSHFPSFSSLFELPPKLEG
jgi:hypothetical protein